MPDIYEMHTAAFNLVSAFVVVKLTRKANVPPVIDRVATVAFKHPKDGAGRLYCYLHIFGGPMVRGFATGGGYDKKTAAAAHAASKVDCAQYGAKDTQQYIDAYAAVKFLSVDGGKHWDDCLREVGFEVFQAV